MKKLILTALALAALALPMSAMAAGGHESHAGHGQPAQGEMPDYSGHFEDLDANKDGSIDMMEFHKGFPKGHHEDFAKMDANGDGDISHDEYHAFKEKHGYGHGDKNHEHKKQ